jgi:ABC-type Fe3+/spermidine/putrescine transport system ATPase subunit
MRVELRELQRRLQIATLFVTHDQEEALTLSDRVILMSAARTVQVDRPDVLYESPETEFAARFLRFRNVVRGELVERTATSVVVSLLSNVSITARPAHDPTPEGPISIAVRPDRIAMTSVAPLRGTIRDRTYLGNSWRYSVDTPIGVLIVETGPADRTEVGTEVGLRIPDLAAQEVRQDP